MTQTLDEFEKEWAYECRTVASSDDVVPWCIENFGDFGARWYRLGTDIGAGWGGGDTRDWYRFRDSKDAVMFRLKWG